MKKIRVVISLSAFILAAGVQSGFGCAQVPHLKGTPQFVSLGVLVDTPDEFDGKYVAVLGILNEDALYFESNVYQADVSSVVFIRPDYRGQQRPDSGVPDMGCDRELVRVFGKFRRLNPTESEIVGAYRVVRVHRRAPGPLDYTCWSNPNADPFQ